MVLRHLLFNDGFLYYLLHTLGKHIRLLRLVSSFVFIFANWMMEDHTYHGGSWAGSLNPGLERMGFMLGWIDVLLYYP